MKQWTPFLLLLMLVLGSPGTPAADSQGQGPDRHGYRRQLPHRLVFNHRNERLIREIERNRFKIEGLRRENHRLAEKMRFQSPRKAHRSLRAIDRNERRIHRLQQENRYLTRRLRPRRPY